jgi:hypothetical protein
MRKIVDRARRIIVRNITLVSLFLAFVVFDQVALLARTWHLNFLNYFDGRELIVK